MPTGTENVGINMMVQPSLDPQAAAKVLKDVAALHKKLATLKVDWSAISKQSGISTKELKKLSKQVSDFTKGLSDATKTSTTNFVKLSGELKKAQEEASDLKAEYTLTKDSAAKKKIAGELALTNKVVTDLNKQLTNHKKQFTSYNSEVKHLTRSQKQYRTQLEQAAKYSPRDMIKDILGSISKGAAGGPKGVVAGVRGAAGAVGKGVKGGAARADLSGMADVIGGITKFAAGFTLAFGALGVFWETIKAASDHMTKLNKTLLEGTGFANDLTMGSKNYADSIDDIRNATIDAQGSLLKFGLNSEKSMKMLNVYTIEATGSINKTKQAVTELGGGNLKRGVETFARNATVYGKALGIEGNEVASMMGKFETEVGYGAGQVQDLMGNIVKSAATANMPMTKFMNIFRSVLPDVELYQNRLEELTATIKLLSKTMSARDVQKFMDAFAKGFKGVDFKQRFKIMKLAGDKNTSETLKKDFEYKANTMAESFKGIIDPKEFTAAVKGGGSAMAKLMAEAQVRASKTGAVITGTQVGDAMELATSEGFRKQGGLGVVTAMRDASAFSTYKLVKDASQRLTKGFGGLSEVVIHNLGISDDQYDMLRKTDQSTKVYQSQLQQYGKTTSKSYNKGLVQTIASRKYLGNISKVTTKDMQEATEEDIFRAAEAQTKNQEDTIQTAEDVAAEQVTATTSIAEKIDNVIGFMLEKMYKILQSMLDVIDSIWNKFAGGDTKTINAIEKWNKGIKESGYSEDAKSQMGMVADAIKDAVGSGGDIVDAVTKSPGFENLAKLDPKIIEDIAKKQGMDPDEAKINAEAFKDAAEKGDRKRMDFFLSAMPDPSGALMEVGQDLLKFGTSKEAQDKAAGRRPGTSPEEIVKKKKEKDESERKKKEAADHEDMNSDTEKNMEKLTGAAGKIAETQQNAAAGIPGPTAPDTAISTRTGTTVVEHVRGAEDQPTRTGTTVVEHVRGAEDQPTRTGTTTVENIRGAAEDQTKELAKGQETASEDQREATDNVYDGINDVAGILKKGIKFEKSWMTSQYKNFVKSTTLEAFEKALTEFAILKTRMEDDPNFKKAIMDNAGDIADSNASLTDIIKTPVSGGDTNNEYIKKLIGTAPKVQSGGLIADGGLYNLHKGEYVVPAGGADAGKGGGGNTVVNLTVNGSNMTPQQFKSAVVSAMDEVARRH